MRRDAHDNPRLPAAICGGAASVGGLSRMDVNIRLQRLALEVEKATPEGKLRQADLARASRLAVELENALGKGGISPALAALAGWNQVEEAILKDDRTCWRLIQLLCLSAQSLAGTRQDIRFHRRKSNSNRNRTGDASHQVTAAAAGGGGGGGGSSAGTDADAAEAGPQPPAFLNCPRWRGIFQAIRTALVTRQIFKYPTVQAAALHLDLVPCISRLLAATCPPPLRPLEAAAADAREGGHPECPSEPTQARLDRLSVLKGAIELVVLISMYGYRARPNAALAAALEASHLFEHAARAVLLSYYDLRRATPLAGRGRHRSGRDSDSDDVACAEVIYTTLHELLICLHVMVAVPGRACGPCVRHLLLCHMVCQVAAADGGGVAGLPAAARLPPVKEQLRSVYDDNANTNFTTRMLLPEWVRRRQEEEGEEEEEEGEEEEGEEEEERCRGRAKRAVGDGGGGDDGPSPGPTRGSILVTKRGNGRLDGCPGGSDSGSCGEADEDGDGGGRSEDDQEEEEEEVEGQGEYAGRVSGDGSSASGGGDWAEDAEEWCLTGSVILGTLRAWARDPALRPLGAACSARALVSLCSRLAAAANGSYEFLTQSPPPLLAPGNYHDRLDDGGGEDGTEEGRGGGAFPLPHCTQIASASLSLALQVLQDGGGGGGAGRGVGPRLWGAITRTLRNAAAEGVVKDVLLRGAEEWGSFRGLLRRLALTPALQLDPPAAGAAWAPEPPPEVAAALAAGFLPSLELLLRQSTALPALAAVLDAATDDFRRPGLLRALLVYGEPRAAAALLASGGKALRAAACVEPVKVAGVLAAVRAARRVLTGSLLSPAAPEAAQEPDERLWWRRWAKAGLESGSGNIDGASAAAAAAASVRAGDGGADDAAAAAADAGMEPGPPPPSPPPLALPPQRQLQLLASIALLTWLPPLSDLAQSLNCLFLATRPAEELRSWVAARSVTANAVLAWVPAIASVCMAHRTAAAAAAGGAAAADAEAEAEASWRHLLFSRMRVVDVIAARARFLAASRRLLPPSLTEIEPTAEALMWLMAAFPDALRQDLGSDAPPLLRVVSSLLLPKPQGGGADVEGAAAAGTEEAGMRGSGAAAGEQALGRIAGHWHELSAAFYLEGGGGGGGGAPGPNHVTRLCERLAARRAVQGDRCWAVALPPAAAAAMPPPGVAAAALGLQLCSYRACVNLDHGDSEAAAAAVLRECGGCRRAVYCSRKCQVADWNEGHKGECRPARATAATVATAGAAAATVATAGAAGAAAGGIGGGGGVAAGAGARERAE
ncbi:hypothetical protein PLESTB_000095000 [Pleodorina starrii]|uniref:phytol kinase n=1 Tax=Pleodorina starrii TaxID=330485 RepID=A0A9W6BAV9_9CHLO|nr:hypothetical protein PLESTB_000095000 [Pleodorina starrii]GLC71736.1 hypothetical protein PLESTF_001160700 [Pleodorina starrii]